MAVGAVAIGAVAISTLPTSRRSIHRRRPLIGRIQCPICCCRPWACALEDILGRGEPRMTRQKSLPFIFARSQPILPHIRSIVARSRAVNIVRPIFDLRRSLHPLLIRFSREISKLPREEPREHNGHSEFDSDDPDDEHKGEVQDNLRCNAADTVSVDEADCGKVLETMANLAIVRAKEVHSDVFAVE